MIEKYKFFNYNINSFFLQYSIPAEELIIRLQYTYIHIIHFLNKYLTFFFIIYFFRPIIHSLKVCMDGMNGEIRTHAIHFLPLYLLIYTTNFKSLITVQQRNSLREMNARAHALKSSNISS